MVTQRPTHRHDRATTNRERGEEDPSHRPSTGGRRQTHCSLQACPHVRPPLSTSHASISHMPITSICHLQALTTCTSSYVSPRSRARRTLELLDIGCRDKLPWQDTHTHCDIRTEAKVQVTADIREWDYGDYEGLTSVQIKEQREKAGEKVWDIWRDGCPGGESPADVTRRLDRLIKDIRTRFHDEAIGKAKGEAPISDVLIVAHGHILRAFAMRWIGRELTDGVSLLLEGMLSLQFFSSSYL